MLNRRKRFIAEIIKNNDIYPIIISGNTKEVALEKLNRWTEKFNWKLINFVDYNVYHQNHPLK